MLRECTFCRVKIGQDYDTYLSPVCIACAIAIEEVYQKFLVEQQRRGK